MIKKLAKIKEEQGLIAEAADLMQEIAVSVNTECCDGFYYMPLVSACDNNSAISSQLTYVMSILNRWKHLVPWQKLRKLHSFLSKYETLFSFLQ